MKIVQSFWSLPSQSVVLEEGREKGGWLVEDIHYLSLALSCLLLKRYNKNVELVTDEFGYELLVGKMKLPYNKVSVCLDSLNHHNKGLWSLSKLYSYSIQEEPFLHVDGDVFLWKSFDNTILESSLCAQSPELHHYELYYRALEHMNLKIKNIPECIDICRKKDKSLSSINAGVLGGNDLKFINQYACTALKLINDNVETLINDDKAGILNIIAEQYLFCSLAKLNNRHVDYIIPKLSYDFSEVVQLNKVEGIQKYVHLIGKAKNNIYSCEQVINRLRYEFPEEYKLILRAIFEKTQPQISASITHNKLSIEEISCKLFNKLHINNIGNNFHIINISDLKNEFPLVIDNLVFEPIEIKRAYDHLSFCKQYDFDNITSSYTRMKKASYESLMNTAFCLDDSCYIIQNNEVLDENINYVIIQKKNDKLIAEKLSDWSELLIYFQNNIITGYELIKDIINKESDKNIKNSIFEFICSHLIYTGYIRAVD